MPITNSTVYFDPEKVRVHEVKALAFETIDLKRSPGNAVELVAV